MEVRPQSVKVRVCAHIIVNTVVDEQPIDTQYINWNGFDRLKQEEKDIWVSLADVTAALSAAAVEGDRSENAVYIKEPLISNCINLSA